MAAPIQREFAGEVRTFELLPADKTKLYRGVETFEHGSILEMTTRGARNALSAAAVAHILSHALSSGHPITLIRMRALVIAEMRVRPLAEFMPLAIDILANAYAGEE